MIAIKALSGAALVELTAAALPVRSRSANVPGLDPATRVYSTGIVPALDRIVTTTTDMHGAAPASRQLQIWRLSDLALLHTITLPNDSSRGSGPSIQTLCRTGSRCACD